MGDRQLCLVETTGDYYASGRQQWDSANIAVTLEPSVVLSYDYKTQTTRPSLGIEIIPIVVPNRAIGQVVRGGIH